MQANGNEDLEYKRSFVRLDKRQKQLIGIYYPITALRWMGVNSDRVEDRDVFAVLRID